MSFLIMTDTSANLPTPMLAENNIKAVPFSYYINDQEFKCTDTEQFDGKRYYADIKSGVHVKTSQITPQRYIDAMTPELESGEDILFISMSSGISGSYQSLEMAAQTLREVFPLRKIRTVDTLAASLGEAISIFHALRCRSEGMSLDETADFLINKRGSVYQVVLLDDLMYLHRGGRVSGKAAIIGTVLGIKPILKGNAEGKLVVCGKIRGRKQGVAELARRYQALVQDAEKQTVCIAYTDCPEDAEKLAQMIRSSKPPKDILTVCYEPVTGSYVGPGTLALFFEGADGVREQ